MKTPNFIRGAALAAFLLPAVLHADERAAAVRFELSFPEGVRREAVDGRVYVVVTKKATPEPRLQFGKTGGQYASSPFFGEDVEGFHPGASAVIDDRANGYPLERLSALPAGDYFVQGVLNVYTTFHRADGHAVRLHMDQWEGQDFPISPGNLFSEPRRVHLDPAAPQTIHLVLDRKIPPIAVPADTEWVKRVRFQSPSLSKFWGQPIWIGATILLPKDYDRDTSVSYPVNYEQGHFSLGAPGGFGDRTPPGPNASEREKERFRRMNEFTQNWKAGKTPKMLFVTFQHPTPYYDDSYAIDSPNMGPYGAAITEELIPYIEKHFRAIREPWARVLSGGSTGGWESLALQIFYPDYFGGTFSYCPDPVDFHYFELVNIYDWDNAWYRKDDWKQTPISGERQPDGLVLSTMKEQLAYERAMGTGGRSGEDWDCWQAVYGPVGANGYFQPVFDPATGSIDHGVAAYWKEHTDLNAYLQRNWSEIGPKLAGKIHIWIGDMDTYYLNDAVHLLDAYLATTKEPAWGGSITYGPLEPHCWSGPSTLSERIQMMADYAAANAPNGGARRGSAP
jgi:Putative esterase